MPVQMQLMACLETKFTPSCLLCRVNDTRFLHFCREIHETLSSARGRSGHILLTAGYGYSRRGREVVGNAAHYGQSSGGMDATSLARLLNR